MDYLRKAEVEVEVDEDQVQFCKPRKGADAPPPGAMKIEMPLNAFLDALHGIHLNDNRVVFYLAPKDAQVLRANQQAQCEITVVVRLRLPVPAKQADSPEAESCQKLSVACNGWSAPAGGTNERLW